MQWFSASRASLTLRAVGGGGDGRARWRTRLSMSAPLRV